MAKQVRKPKAEAKPARSSLLSAKTEYACIALLELASRHNDTNPVSLKDIAEKNGISHRFLVLILLQLKAGGLVTSTRGASGGYQLTRPPERTTLADIIDVIDPPEPIRTDEATTPTARTVRGVWEQILKAQRTILETTTLADLWQKAQAEYEIVYQI